MAQGWAQHGYATNTDSVLYAIDWIPPKEIRPRRRTASGRSFVAAVYQRQYTLGTQPYESTACRAMVFDAGHVRIKVHHSYGAYRSLQFKVAATKEVCITLLLNTSSNLVYGSVYLKYNLSTRSPLSQSTCVGRIEPLPCLML
jgi:hypothetical protein